MSRPGYSDHDSWALLQSDIERWVREAASPPPTSAWQSIDTAPKDRTKFLAFGRGYDNHRGSYDTDEPSKPMFSVCHWDWFDDEKLIEVEPGLFKKEPCRVLDFWRCEFGFIPTHWTPLPSSPNERASTPPTDPSLAVDNNEK